MNEIILFKGQYEIIRRPETIPKAAKLYDFICNFFQEKDYSCRLVETNSEKSAGDYISNNTKYLIGHSNGTIRILREFIPSEHLSVKGIILLDTRLEFVQQINIWKLIFLSKRWQFQEYKSESVIGIDDDHYFNNSFDIIRYNMDKFLVD